MNNERLIDRYNRRWRRRLLLIKVRAVLFALALLFASIYAGATFGAHPTASVIIFLFVIGGVLALDE